VHRLRLSGKSSTFFASCARSMCCSQAAGRRPQTNLLAFASNHQTLATHGRRTWWASSSQAPSRMNALDILQLPRPDAFQKPATLETIHPPLHQMRSRHLSLPAFPHTTARPAGRRLLLVLDWLLGAYFLEIVFAYRPCLSYIQRTLFSAVDTVWAVYRREEAGGNLPLDCAVSLRSRMTEGMPLGQLLLTLVNDCAYQCVFRGFTCEYPCRMTALSAGRVSGALMTRAEEFLWKPI
jgi:hypothetical protein